MRSPSAPAWTLLLFTSFAVSGCGSGRQLQSVSLNPAKADAQNGPVAFTATGTFSKPPSPATLTSQDVVWCAGTNTGACAGNINPGARVDQNGLAECNSGFVGTATILAGKGTSAMGNPDAGEQLHVFGSAQLTCP